MEGLEHLFDHLECNMVNEAFDLKCHTYQFHIAMTVPSYFLVQSVEGRRTEPEQTFHWQISRMQ